MAEVKSDRALEPRAERRSATLIRGLSHAAIRVKDIETTRSFYEGLLDLPMTHARVASYTTESGENRKFIHAFFEMGEGFVAFFEVVGTKDKPFQQSGDNVETHFAMRVSSEDDLRKFEKKLKDAGVKCEVIRHAWCTSLYFNDPDDWPLEIAHHFDEADTVLDEAEIARDNFAKWLAENPRNALAST